MLAPPWELKVLEQRLKRGSHKSCNENLDFIREEMLDFVKKGFWTVLPYRLLKEKFKQELRYLRDLRLSPMGVVPQRERRPRLIVDYSFYEINQTTLGLGPKEAMQFGRTLERVLYQVRHSNPRFGPVYIGKVDLADGFYRVWLALGAIPKLAVALPLYEGEEPMVALPLTLPMGWMDSVPYFCSATETVADIANNKPNNVHLAHHPLEKLANTLPPDTLPPTINAGKECAKAQPSVEALPVLRPFYKPTRFTDVFIDDFILGVQGNALQRLQHMRRLLHAIDQVFRPVDANDLNIRNHVPSVKKFLKGDAYLNTRKERPWQLVHLRSEMHSTLIKALQQQRLMPQLFLKELSPKMATGAFGKTSLPLLKALTPTLVANPIQSSFLFSRFLPRDSAPVSLPPAVDLSGVDQWRTTYGPSERRSLWMTRHA